MRNFPTGCFGHNLLEYSVLSEVPEIGLRMPHRKFTDLAIMRL